MTVEEKIKELESLSSEKLEKANRLDNIVNDKLVVDMCDVDLIEATLCRKKANDYIQISEWLKELQAHRYAWAKLREDIRDEAEFAYADFDEYKYEVLGIDDVDDLPNDDYKYGMERALELIDIYRPKEGDAE